MITKVKDINFLPERIVLARAKRKKNVLLTIFTVLLLGAFVTPYGFLQWQTSESREELAALQNDYQKVKTTAREVDKIIADRTRLEDETGQLQNIIHDRRTWPDMLRDIETAVPEEVWFILLELTNDQVYKPAGESSAEHDTSSAKQEQEKSTPTQSPQNSTEPAPVRETTSDYQKGKTGDFPSGPINLVVITGKCGSLEPIGRFIYKLNQLPYFKEVKLQEIKRNSKEEILTGELNFVIMAPLKEGAGHAK